MPSLSPTAGLPCDSAASISAGLFQRTTEGKVEADQRSIYVGNVSEGCGTGPSLLLLVWQVCAMVPSKGTWPLPCKRLAAPNPTGHEGCGCRSTTGARRRSWNLTSTSVDGSTV